MATVVVNVRNVYGNELIYPANETAQFLAELARQKTFTERDISLIRKLGYTIEVTQQASPVAERLKA